jgi:hypothetical protein
LRRHSQATAAPTPSLHADHRSLREPRAPVWLLRPGDVDQQTPMKKIASLLSTTGVLVALVAVCEAAVKWV